MLITWRTITETALPVAIVFPAILELLALGIAGVFFSTGYLLLLQTALAFFHNHLNKKPD